MTRFLLPFLLALSIHGLISQLSWEQNRVQQPESGGKKSIVIAIEHISAPAKQQQAEPQPKEIRAPAQPKASPVNVEKKEESLSQPQLSEPAKVRIKPEKHKSVKKRPQSISASATNTLEKTPQAQLKQYTEPTAFSNNSLASKAPKQKIAPITAKPLYQQNQKPPYPPLARRRNWQGTVLLLVTVDVKGLSKNVHILKRSGYSLLDKTAKKTVQKWKFSPGTVNGRPTEMQVQVPIHFKLE